MAGKHKKPEADILTPQNSQQDSRRGARENASTPPPTGAPIIDMTDPKKSRFAAGLFWGVAGGLMGSAAMVALIYTAYFTGKPLPSPFAPAPLSQAQEQKLVKVEQRVQNIENNQQRVGAALDVFADIDGRLGDLRTQYDEDMAAAQQNLAALHQAQQQLEAGLNKRRATSPAQSQIASMPETELWQSILLAQLGHAVMLGQPYALELSALQQTLSPKEAAALEKLSPYADNGLPPLHVLMREYQNRLPDLLSDWRRQQARGFWGVTKAMLQNLMTIRPVRPVRPAPNTNVNETNTEEMARADVEQLLWRIDDGLTHIQNGGARLEGLEKIQSLLTRLPNTIQADLSDWSDKIKARVQAENLLRSLSGRLAKAQKRGP